MLQGMLAIPIAIAAIAFADRFSSRPVYGNGFAQILTLCGQK